LYCFANTDVVVMFAGFVIIYSYDSCVSTIISLFIVVVDVVVVVAVADVVVVVVLFFPYLRTMEVTKNPKII